MAMQHQHNDGQMNDLILNIYPQLHRRLTRAAAQSNLSLEEYVGCILERLFPLRPMLHRNEAGSWIGRR
jgi:predicted HicB family RNase H-like nuclease